VAAATAQFDDTIRQGRDQEYIDRFRHGARGGYDCGDYRSMPRTILRTAVRMGVGPDTAMVPLLCR